MLYDKNIPYTTNDIVINALDPTNKYYLQFDKDTYIFNILSNFDEYKRKIKGPDGTKREVKELNTI